MILYKIQEFWHEHGFNILLVLAVVFLLGMWLLSKKGSGTYSVQPPISLTPAPPQLRMASTPPQTQSSGNNGKESTLERRCRQSLQEIFGRPFDKARPDFLRNPVTKNFNLELDCFDAQLKLAVEAQGIQHYKYVPYFHKNKDAFQNQQYRDELKRRMCRDNGINLIEVPYTVKESDVKNYILRELRIRKYRV